MIRIAGIGTQAGSTIENLHHYLTESQSQVAEVALIGTNNPKSGLIERANRLGIELVIFEDADMADGSLLEIFEEKDIGAIVCGGFMSRISDEVIARYSKRIFNIHRSLLPLFGGKNMFGANVINAELEAFHRGEIREAGCTTHFIDPGPYDSGEIIHQYSFPLVPDETFETLEDMTQMCERYHFPRQIERVLAAQESAG